MNLRREQPNGREKIKKEHKRKRVLVSDDEQHGGDNEHGEDDADDDVRARKLKRHKSSNASFERLKSHKAHGATNLFLIKKNNKNKNAEVDENFSTLSSSPLSSSSSSSFQSPSLLKRKKYCLETHFPT